MSFKRKEFNRVKGRKYNYTNKWTNLSAICIAIYWGKSRNGHKLTDFKAIKLCKQPFVPGVSHERNSTQSKCSSLHKQWLSEKTGQHCVTTWIVNCQAETKMSKENCNKTYERMWRMWQCGEIISEKWILIVLTGEISDFIPSARVMLQRSWLGIHCRKNANIRKADKKWPNIWALIPSLQPHLIGLLLALFHVVYAIHLSQSITFLSTTADFATVKVSKSTEFVVLFVWL